MLAIAATLLISAGQAQTLNLPATLNSGTYSATSTVTNCTGAVSQANCTSVVLANNANVTLAAGQQIIFVPGADLVAAAGTSLIAMITSANTYTVATSPAGLQVTVDGVACSSNCAYQWVPGSQHTIAATQLTATSTQLPQYVFASWNDGGAVSHTITARASAPAFTASYATQYYLTTTANPSTEGTISPATGWVNAGSVAVSSAPAAGYLFTGFSGGLTGATTPQILTLNAPATVSANFAPAPDFTIAVTPPASPVAMAGGAGATYTVTVGSLNGFNGAVTLTAPPLPRASPRRSPRTPSPAPVPPH